MAKSDTSLLGEALEGYSGQLPSLPLPLGEIRTVTISCAPYLVDERDRDNPSETTGNKVLVVDIIADDAEEFTIYLQSGMLTALARANRLAGLPIDTLVVGSRYSIVKTGVGNARPGRNAPNLYTWRYVSAPN